MTFQRACTLTLWTLILTFATAQASASAQQAQGEGSRGDPSAAGADAAPREHPPLLLTSEQPLVGPPASPGTSLLLSIGLTTASLLSTPMAGSETLFLPIFGALMVAPSAGQMYAGGHLRAWAHAGGRFAAAAGFALLSVLLLPSLDSEYQWTHAEQTRFSLAVLSGLATWAGLSIWSIVDGWKLCKAQQKQWNRQQAWHVTPLIAPGPRGRRDALTAGLQVHHSF